MRLAKWQGLGNDYLVVDESELGGELTAKAVSLLCDRHLGLGSDGILLSCRPTGAIADAVARMRIFNPDGSESEMCGNGMRIFARYLGSRGVVGDQEFTVETLAGAIRPRLIGERDVRVDMGLASFHGPGISPLASAEEVGGALLDAGGQQYRFTFVDVGNPHCVIQVDDPAAFDVCGIGPLIEVHRYFPNRVNAEFISVLQDGSVRMRVWERGVGETQACGTGATAVGAACVRLGLVESPVVVHLLGGDLVIEADPGGDDDDRGSLRVHMSGPAEEVFSAEVSRELLERIGWR
jgi:diaminopimelate epimerase